MRENEKKEGGGGALVGSRKTGIKKEKKKGRWRTGSWRIRGRERREANKEMEDSEHTGRQTDRQR